MIELKLEQRQRRCWSALRRKPGKPRPNSRAGPFSIAWKTGKDYEAGIAALKESEGQPTFSLEEVVNLLTWKVSVLAKAQSNWRTGRNRAKSILKFVNERLSAFA